MLSASATEASDEDPQRGISPIILFTSLMNYRS